jgi:hypothetical protein
MSVDFAFFHDASGLKIWNYAYLYYREVLEYENFACLYCARDSGVWKFRILLLHKHS